MCYTPHFKILVVLSVGFYVYIQMDADESGHLYKTHIYIKYLYEPINYLN